VICPWISSRELLLLGRGELARAVHDAAGDRGWTVRQLQTYTERQLRRGLAEADAVAVVSRDDAEALRAALLVEHIQPGIQLVVTVFDLTVAGQVRRVVPNCRVLSLADAVAPTAVAACLDGAPVVERSHPTWLRVALRPIDASGRLLVGGLAALFALLSLELLIGITVLHEPFDRALYSATNVLETVDANHAVNHGPTWVRLVSSCSAVLTLISTAAFTAGLVNHFTSRRLVTLVGRRVPPRRGHIVVVGLGQVGLRLCLELRRLGVPVLAIERDDSQHHVAIARNAGIPVVLGHGEDRALLETIGAVRARAVAAVTSTDTTNIEVIAAARTVAPEVPVVLRAGDDSLASETRFLFRIGTVIDANVLAGVQLAALLDGPE
jgi:voltage-gated potassium channel Kch